MVGVEAHTFESPPTIFITLPATSTWILILKSKIWGVTNRRNKQVPNGVVANVDYCIGDDVLNELDRIAKNIVDQCNNSEGGVGSVEESEIKTFEKARIQRKGTSCDYRIRCRSI